MNRSLFLALMMFVLAPHTGLAQTTVITGARIHTVGPQGTLDNATIVIEDGLIQSVGTDVTVPPGATVVDGSGKVVTPGIFSPIGSLGLSEVSAVAGSNDLIQRGDQFTAAFDVSDAYNPRSTAVAVSRIDGITRAAITPVAAAPDGEGNSSRVLSGLGSIVQLGDSDEHFMRRAAVVVANFGETGSGVAGGSRAAAAMILRSALDDALDYRDNRVAVLSGQWRNYSVSTADLEALQNVLNGSVPLLINVDRASDIEVVLALAAEFNLRIIIAGGAEAWLVADHIAAASVPVILDIINNLPNNFDQLNARMDAAALLENAGVTLTLDAGSLGAGGRTHNSRNLTQVAGIAVANGMSWDGAMAAITRVPAEMYGVDAEVGSLEVGKEADLVVWPGDPFELSNYPDQVYIQGVAVDMQSRQTLLRDRYLDPDADLPPAYRK